MKVNNFIHHTKDGSSMPISQMTDKHLLNTIRLMSLNFRYDQMIPYIFDAARRGLDASEYLHGTGIAGVVPITFEDEDDESFTFDGRDRYGSIQ